MKRTFLVGGLALALVVPATAQAAFTSGNYRGRTSQQGPVSFTASQFKLSKFRIGVVWRCTDGDRFQTDLPASAPRSYFPAQNILNGRRVALGNRGKYSATFTGSGGASTYNHRGRIVNQRATGTFTGRRTYNTDDELDPNGTVICTTGLVRYSILHV